MLRLHWTLALFLWYFLLPHRRAWGDEEAHWGPTPSNEKPSAKKSGFSWWRPSTYKLPVSFNIPFYGGSDKSEGRAATTAAANGPTESNHLSPDDGGSGGGSVQEGSRAPDTSTQELLTSVEEIGTESPPQRTSDWPHRSEAQSNKDALVSSPTGRFIANTWLTSDPSSGSTPEQNATHTHAPWSATEESQLSIGVTTEAAEQYDDLLQKISSTTDNPIIYTATEPAMLTTQSQVTLTTSTSKQALGSVAYPTHAAISPATPTRETTPSQTHSAQTQAELIHSQAVTRNPEPELEATPTTLSIDHKLDTEFITSPISKATFPITGETPRTESVEEEEHLNASSLSTMDKSTPNAERLTTPLLRSTRIPSTAPTTLLVEDWMSNPTRTDFTLLPDCNQEHSGICNTSYVWDTTPSLDVKPTHNTTAMNQSNNPLLMPAPPMLVPLYTDWNSAMAAWGFAWETHVYGAGCVFALLTLASALNLLCLPLRCPSGCGYFTLVSLFLLAAGCIRSFSLLYDAYGHQDRIRSTEASLMLHEAPFPCMTAAFGLVFLLLSMRSRMQLSYSAFQRPCFLACLVVLHFAAAFGPITLLKLYQQKPYLCLFLSLTARGAFVALATFLSAAYFVFYIYVRADSKHIYHLNNTSPTPAERYNRCPFADSRDWNRAALIVCLSALFSLACAGLQLYAMLNALGVAGGREVFHPWPWWTFQFSCRVCELGVCLTLAFVVAQPIYCSDQLPGAGSCWTELLACKSPILPGTYQWTLTQHEKLAIVDTVGLGETESLPLYTLMDERLGSSLNGLDLLYHSNRALAYRDLDVNTSALNSEKLGAVREPSGGSSFTSDSTTDLRPPSPINLRRSIDEALFSEALFPMSLFSPTRPFHCSDRSVNDRWAVQGKEVRETPSDDPGLYRTSSCLEMVPQQSQTSSSYSSPERWRGSSSSCSLYRASLGGSSTVLCPSPGGQAGPRLQGGGMDPTLDPQRQYQTLGALSQESLNLSTEADLSVQEEFISVCRQIDASSICSETIDL